MFSDLEIAADKAFPGWRDKKVEPVQKPIVVEERIGTWESWIEGPKWAHVGTAIKQWVLQAHCEIVYMNAEKRWFTETVFFKIRGKETYLKILMDTVLEGLREYNK